jgi:Tfp pilus assembly protein FimT
MTFVQSPRGLTLLQRMVTLAIVATMAAPSLQNLLIRDSTATMANEFTGSVLRTRNAATGAVATPPLVATTCSTALRPARPIGAFASTP